MHASSRSPLLLALLACQVGSSFALRVPFKRADTVAQTVPDPFAFDVVDLHGDNEVIYVSNITVNGQSFEVQLDTGSSDFWLDTRNVQFSDANSTNITATIVYGDTTSASGDILTAPIQFGNYSVAKQAFISAPGSNATADGDKGLMGLGPPLISAVNNKLNDTSFNGNTVLDNIFMTYQNVSTYITFLLARTNLGVADGGIFTIGEVDPNWSAITNATKVTIVQGLEQWIGVMDGVVVNGKTYDGHGLLSKVPHVDPEFKGKLLSLFDTGTSMGSVPQFYFDAMYKHIPGFKAISEADGLYEIPCDSKLNVSMVFNGTEYPINPLDLTRVISLEGNSTTCVNTFTPQKAKMERQEGVDFVLGDSFLRNVYILYNYGNWSKAGTDAPYVQLLSTTNQTDAWEQYDSLSQARTQQWVSLDGHFKRDSANTSATSTAK